MNNSKFIFSYFLFMVLFQYSIAQKSIKEKSIYNLTYDPLNLSRPCNKCVETLSLMPQGVFYSLHRDGNIIVFIMNDLDWFKKIFKNNNDGLAVDIIQRKQFECGRDNDFKTNNYNRGVLTKPFLLRQMKKLPTRIRGTEVVIPVAEIPENLLDKEDLEFNLLFIRKNHVCYYTSFYNLPRSRLDLLKMDIYMDTLSAQSQDSNKVVTFNKKLEFIIPFEKNKFEYRPLDLKPAYDSLNLTTYNIKSIQLRAYSSIEGSESRNIELQQKRAESIIKSLQSFQNMEIQNEVNASENWVEFIQDVSATQYAEFKLLSREEIKAELEKKEVANDLEPILKNHRKAVLFVELERKSSYRTLSSNEAIKYFSQAVNEKRISDAYEIQQAIFENVESKAYESSIIGELEVPESKENCPLLINNLVFNFSNQNINFYSLYTNLQKLEILNPSNRFIKYNLAVAQLWMLQEGELVIDRKIVGTTIANLKKYKVDPRLIRRLQINYNIIMADLLYIEKKYEESDNYVKYIYQNYKSTNYKDEDLLRLSKYFVVYHKRDWALKCIENRVSKIDVSEDLLFYYINLTITNSDLTKKENYRSVFLNAYNINKYRFCELFNSFALGGISFQLLGDKNLKKSYCELCSNNKAN